MGLGLLPWIQITETTKAPTYYQCSSSENTVLSALHRNCSPVWCGRTRLTCTEPDSKPIWINWLIHSDRPIYVNGENPSTKSSSKCTVLLSVCFWPKHCSKTWQKKGELTISSTSSFLMVTLANSFSLKGKQQVQWFCIQVQTAQSKGQLEIKDSVKVSCHIINVRFLSQLTAGRQRVLPLLFSFLFSWSSVSNHWHGLK